MIRTILQKEVREIIISRKFAVTFGAAAILILLCFYAGARNYEVSRATYEAAVAENLRQMEGITVSRYFDLQPKAMLPPEPLAVLVSGISNDVGRQVTVRGRGVLNPERSRYGEEPVFAAFRFLDLEFIFQVVLALFAILFAYDSINGEKERGTLRLILSNAVPRAHLIAGKLLGTFLALVVPLLIPILLGCLLLLAMDVPMSGEDWLRLALILLAGILYVSVFLGLSVCVSAVTRRSSSSFLLLLVMWIVLVTILPRASVLAAGRHVDVPPLDGLLAEAVRYERQLFQESMREMQSAMPRARTGEGGVLLQPSSEEIQELQRRHQEMADRREELAREHRERLFEHRNNLKVRQERLALNLSRLSPASVFSLAATELAGTALSLKDHFHQALADYQQAFDRWLRMKTGGSTTGGPGGIMVIAGAADEQDEFIDPREVPVFTFDLPPLAESLRAVLLDLGLLALANLLFFGAAFAAFLRYDVR